MKQPSYKLLILLSVLLPVNTYAIVVLTDSTFKAGADAEANSFRSFAWQGRATGQEAIAMGRFTEAAHSNSVALGFGAWTSGEFGVAIGASYEATYNGNPYLEPTWFREITTHAGFQSVAIGSGAAADAESIALGIFAFSDGGSTAIGYGAAATGNSLAFGTNLSGFASNNSVALSATAENNSFAALGGNARNGSVAIGDGTMASQGGVALGRLNRDVRRDGSAITTTASPLDPLLEIGNPVFRTEVVTYWDDGHLFTETVEYWERQNAFALYRDNVARFEGPVQIKSGEGYVTLQPGTAGNRTISLPDVDGTMLTSSSTLDATKLSGSVPEATLPADVSRLGDSIDLASESTGNLEWSRVESPPTTLAGYGITDSIPVTRDAEGLITSPIRIAPQGDIPMF